jgi:hypothetical protein
MDKIASRANLLSQNCPEYTSEDFVQHMAKAIIEKADRTPTFLDQTDSYVLKYAWFKGKHLATHAYKYLEYVDEQGSMSDGPSTIARIHQDAPEDTEDSELEFCEDKASTNPEQATIKAETLFEFRTIIEEFSPENQKVVKMLWQGHTRAEIAEAMGISRPSITQRIGTIAKKFASLEFQALAG